MKKSSTFHGLRKYACFLHQDHNFMLTPIYSVDGHSPLPSSHPLTAIDVHQHYLVEGTARGRLVPQLAGGGVERHAVLVVVVCMHCVCVYVCMQCWWCMCMHAYAVLVVYVCMCMHVHAVVVVYVCMCMHAYAVLVVYVCMCMHVHAVLVV